MRHLFLAVCALVMAVSGAQAGIMKAVMTSRPS